MRRSIRRNLTALALLPLFGLAACGGEEAVEEADFTDTEAVEDTTMPPAVEGEGDTMGGEAAEGALLDPDVASQEELAGLPGMDQQLAMRIVEGRPWTDMTELDAALAESLDETQREELYRHLWKPIDLNEASAEEILLIPGVGDRMQHEFEEYRPYRAMAEFEREIGKYVDEDEVQRLARYVEIRE